MIEQLHAASLTVSPAICGKYPTLVKGYIPVEYRKRSGLFPASMEGGQEMPMLVSRIEERLASLRMSARFASEAAVQKPDLIREIKRGHRPSADRLAKLADVLETTPDYLLGRTDDPNAPNGRVVTSPTGAISSIRSLVKDLPVYGTALGSDLLFLGAGEQQVAIEQTTIDMSGAIDFLRRPPALATNRAAYGVIVTGDSMFPRFQNGETILVDPRRPPSVGNDVIVQIRAAEGEDERVVRVLVKTLVRRTAHFVELEQFNPRQTFRVPVESVSAIHRVVPWGEALSL